MESDRFFDDLAQDHRHFMMLFEQLDTRLDDRQELEHVFPRLRDELYIHTVAEEATLYRAMRDKPETKELVPIAEDEHARVRELMDEMSDMEVGTEQWRLALQQLRALVLDHVREEESTFFDRMRSCFSDAELDALSARFIEEKAGRAAA